PRLLLSPNCGGGYGERKQFLNDGASGLADDSSNPQPNCEGFKGVCDSHFLDARVPTDTSCMCEHLDQNEFSGTLAYPGDKAPLNSIQDSCHSIPQPSSSYSIRSKPKLSYLQVSRENTCICACVDNVQSTCGAQIEKLPCQAPTENDERCPLSCCFPMADIDCLRENIDQACLMSMLIHALHYNQGSMMVCARALNAPSISRLVRMSGSLLVSEALLYLYFISLEEKDLFTEVAVEDLFLLHERTLRVEVSRLCQMAWTDAPISD
ncbi:hypothetical protein EGW08_018424, partial [Elysia chlorotica]